jgi:hypothetical protein
MHSIAPSSRALSLGNAAREFAAQGAAWPPVSTGLFASVERATELIQGYQGRTSSRQAGSRIRLAPIWCRAGKYDNQALTIGLIKSVEAQMPNDLGVAEAMATIMTPVGAEVLPRVANPALPVSRASVLDAYPAAWDRPVPPELQQAVHTAEPR